MYWPKRYIINIGIWAAGFGKAHEAMRSYLVPLKERLAFYVYWLFDVGLNTLTGGDPEESISSRVEKDRGEFLPDLVRCVLNKIDAYHTVRARNPNVGEGTPLDRELPGYAQWVVTLAWLGVLLWIFI